MGKMKKLFNKERVESVQEHIDVVFAVFTIVMFANHKIQKHREKKDETEQIESNSAVAS